MKPQNRLVEFANSSFRFWTCFFSWTGGGVACARNSFVIILEKKLPLTPFRVFAESPLRNPKVELEVGLVTIQDGPTSRKCCNDRVTWLLWRYCSGCLRNNVVIINLPRTPPTPQKKIKSKIRISSLQARQVDSETS